jgi:hypothetical protein
MPDYKEIQCDICGGKTYLSNYFYQHKKSKRHQRNMISIEKKQELLNLNNNEKSDYEKLKDYINIIDENIMKIKNYYNKINNE